MKKIATTNALWIGACLILFCVGAADAQNISRKIMEERDEVLEARKRLIDIWSTHPESRKTGRQQDFYLYLTQFYTWENEDWQLFGRTETAYYPEIDCFFKENETELLDESGWVNNQRVRFGIDSEDNFVFLIEIWADNVWIPFELDTILIIDEQGNVTEWERSFYDAEQEIWVSILRNRTGYDTNGNIEIDLFEEWNDETMNWEFAFRDTYTYDVSNTLISITTNMWNGLMWENYFLLSYENNVDGTVAVELGEIWNSASSEYVNESRSGFSYDGTGKKGSGKSILQNLLLIELQLWRNEAWVDTTYTSFNYDASGNRIESIQEVDLIGDGVPQLDSRQTHEYQMTCNELLTITPIETIATLPAQFGLQNNYPNPFSHSTTISFSIPVPGHVELAVYDILGKNVAIVVNGILPAGAHKSVFDASGFPSGVYIYRLEAEKYSESRLMNLVH